MVVYKEARVKRQKQLESYKEIENLKVNSEQYDRLYKTVNDMRKKLEKLIKVASKFNIKTPEVDYCEDPREQLALNLYSKMQALNFE